MQRYAGTSAPTEAAKRAGTKAWVSQFVATRGCKLVGISEQNGIAKIEIAPAFKHTNIKPFTHTGVAAIYNGEVRNGMGQTGAAEAGFHTLPW